MMVWIMGAVDAGRLRVILTLYADTYESDCALRGAGKLFSVTSARNLPSTPPSPPHAGPATWKHWVRVRWVPRRGSSGFDNVAWLPDGITIAELCRRRVVVLLS